MARLLTPTLRPRVEPRRVHDWEDSRRATWLELFYDLVFVVVVSRLATLLHADHGLTGVLTYVGLFVPVWWAWMGYTWYASAFDNDDAVFRVSWFAAMGLVIAMAAGAVHAAWT